jgi:hypothetical protein
MTADRTSPLERFRDDGPLAAGLRRRAAGLPGTLVLGLAVAVAGTSVLASDALARVPIVTGALLLALLGAAGRSSVRLGWLEPALLRAVEYGTVIVLLGGQPVTYLLLAGLAYRHYDQVYAHRHAPGNPPEMVSNVAGGWELRTGLLIAATPTGVVTTVAMSVTAIVVLTSVVGSVVAWRVPER